MTRRIAHRGDSLDFLENTIEAFESAVQQGVNGLEIDLHLSADGEIMVFHDDTLSRLAGEPFAIATRSTAELIELPLFAKAGRWDYFRPALRFGSADRIVERESRYRRMEFLGAAWDHITRKSPFPLPAKRREGRIPTLSHLLHRPTLKTAIQNGLTLCLEFKSLDVVAPTLALIAKLGYESNVIYLSFDLAHLTAARALSPTARLNVSIDDKESIPTKLTTAAALNPFSAYVSPYRITPTLIDDHPGTQFMTGIVNARWARESLTKQFPTLWGILSDGGF